MNATGIVRRVDDLGRIVITKEIRRKLCIREGEPLELYLGDDFVAFKKHYPSKTVRDALDVLHDTVRDEPTLENQTELLTKIRELYVLLNPKNGGGV